MLLVSAAARYKLLPSNGERTTMADGEVEEEEPQAGDRKGKGKKEKKKLGGRRDGVTHCLI